MNIFNKYVWLLDLLRRKNRLTLEEINNEWYDSDLNIDGSELNARTFFRWKNAIEELFEIIIECDKSNGYCYYIQNTEELENGKVTSWMVDTFTVSNMIAEYKNLNDRIILEDVPSTEVYLRTFLEAMKKSLCLSLVYHPYQEEAVRSVEDIEPYFIRLFERRWYAVVRYVSSGEIRIIGLDRIKSLVATEKSFVMPEHFDAKEYFMYDYGVGVGYDDQPCLIRLKVNNRQCPYTRALPLHKSQKEIETTDEYSVFEYFLKPSKDFARAILPFGMNYEVLEPKELRNTIAAMARQILQANNTEE